MKYNIPSELIEEYILSKFTNYKLTSDELIATSPFPDGDDKPRFSINITTGLWRVFGTSSRQGNIFHLYSFLEKVTYKQAVRKFLFKSLDTVNLINTEPIKEEVCYQSSQIPLDWIEITPESYSHEDSDVMRAFGYLLKRKLFNLLDEDPQRFYIVKEGLLKDRLIIPLMEDGEMFFWTARSLNNSNPKYLHASSEEYTKASHILYPFNYEVNYVVICEGIFDVIALQNLGVNSTCVFGANVSDIQLEILKEYGGRIVAGFDADKAGKDALVRLEKKRKKLSLNSFYVTLPPEGNKDWCEAYEKGIDLAKHIKDSSVLYDFYYVHINLL